MWVRVRRIHWHSDGFVVFEVVSITMKKFVYASVVAVLAISLSGCASSPKTYSTVAELESAYVASGGVCDDSTVVDTSAFTADNKDLTGLAGVSCSNDVGMFVFPSNTARDYFVDLVDAAATAAKSGIHMIIGEKWMVAGVSLDNNKFAGPLGGTARY